jgi:hypothetical protein
VQSNRNCVIANAFSADLAATNLCFFNSETNFSQRFSDVEVGYGTEQTAVNASFL